MEPVLAATANQAVTEATGLGVSDVGNDQGGQIRLNWVAPCGDNASGSPQITHYTIWRRIDPLSKTYPPGDWDFIADVPSCGEAEYNVIAPTLADSNGTGLHLSYFFVRAMTASPFTYFDSAVANGYSVDNLAPAPPAGVARVYAGGVYTITWNQNLEPDLYAYKLYRGESAGFIPDESNLISTQGDTGYNDPAPVNSYYKLSAVDQNGNASDYVLVNPDLTDVPTNKTAVKFSLSADNPTTGRIGARFSLPTAGPVQLILYNVGGAKVADIIDAQYAAGTHAVTYNEPVAAGMYFLRLTAGNQTAKLKISVLQ